MSHDRADELRDAAFAALEKSHAPYSGFRVGAALLTTDGKVVTGCNVENASFGLAMCAERNAVFTAIASGATSFEAVAIATDGDDPAPPCGACLQVLAEFSKTLSVDSYASDGTRCRWSLDSLLPHPFEAALLPAAKGR